MPERTFRERDRKLISDTAVHSLVYAVAQYFGDEAGDAVHTLTVPYPTRDPGWVVMGATIAALLALLAMRLILG